MVLTISILFLIAGRSFACFTLLFQWPNKPEDANVPLGRYEKQTSIFCNAAGLWYHTAGSWRLLLTANDAWRDTIRWAVIDRLPGDPCTRAGVLHGSSGELSVPSDQDLWWYLSTDDSYQLATGLQITCLDGIINRTTTSSYTTTTTATTTTTMTTTTPPSTSALPNPSTTTRKNKIQPQIPVVPIAGAATGGVLLVVTVLVLIICLRKRKCKKKPVEKNDFSNLTAKCKIEGKGVNYEIYDEITNDNGEYLTVTEPPSKRQFDTTAVKMSTLPDNLYPNEHGHRAQANLYVSERITNPTHGKLPRTADPRLTEHKTHKISRVQPHRQVSERSDASHQSGASHTTVYSGRTVSSGRTASTSVSSTKQKQDDGGYLEPRHLQRPHADKRL